MTIFIYFIEVGKYLPTNKVHIKWAVVRTGGLGYWLHSNLQSIQWISRRTTHITRNGSC